MTMKKIITTLAAMTFVLGLAAASQAQMAKTPEKPVVQGTQATPPETVKPKEPVAQEAVKTGAKTKQSTITGGQIQGKPVTPKETQKVTKQGGPKAQSTDPATKPLEPTK
jgi:hypothetical protein